jgi:hypothetical protein
MNEATPQGADLQSAAKAIGSLMDANEKKQPAEQPQQQTKQQQESEDQSYNHKYDDSNKQQRNEEPDNEVDTDANNDSDEAQNDLPGSLDQLAESIKLDNQKLLTLKVKTKIDGQDGEATLGDLIKSYQLEGHLTKKSMALSEQQKAFEAHQQQQQQAAMQQMQELHSYSQFLEQEIFKEYHSVDWNSLREYNPAEYSARVLDFQNRKAQIDAFSQQVGQRFQHERAKQQHEFTQKQEGFKNFVSEIVKQEEQALLEKVPEWKTPEKRDAGQKELRSYLKSQGFDEDDMNAAIDHRYVLIARKAMLYDKMAQTKPETLQKAKQLPTFIKQSGVKSKADIRAEQRSGKLKQLRKTGSVKDAAAALFDII